MIFFNSSMPRACSTILQNILAQNPSIHVTPTDGVLELLYGARTNLDSPEFKAMDDATRMRSWRAFCRGGLESYCASLSDRPHTCVKSRGIGIHYHWFSAFMGSPVKVVCMVRDIRAIFASMEKIFRSQQERHQSIQNHAAMRGTTTMKRCLEWLNSQPIGLALERFRQMQLEGIDKRCLFVRAEDLTTNPAVEMSRVYGYLGLDECVHDFNNVEQVTQEDDAVFGLTMDLHKIRPVVSPLKADHLDVLGRDVCRMLSEACSDYQSMFNYR